MSPHKEEEGRKAEVQAEVVKAEEDSREVITQGRTILIEDNPIEVAGNLEVEEEEVVMTGAQTRESLEWLAEPLTRTGVTTAMSLDISQENAPRGIMAITTIGLNSTKLSQDLMWFNHRCMLRCQFLKWLKFQFRWQSHQPKYRWQNNSMTDQTAAMGHMREVMMQMQDVTADDNPCYMHMSEIPREGEASLNF